MFAFSLPKKTIVMAISVFVMCLVSDAHAQPADVISLKQLKPDKACGPRCLYAFMQVTGQGKTGCDIKCIYKLIGKEPLSPTNLLELKNAAQQLGLAATGYKLTNAGLQKIDGYAILPVGETAGTAQDPVHFILVKPHVRDYVRMINPKTLKAHALPISDLTESWNGHALVLSAGADGGQDTLQKEPHIIKTTPEKTKALEYEQIKDFGLVDAGSVLKHTFTIPGEKNALADTEILAKSCSCVEAGLGQDPNGRLVLTMELKIDKPASQMAYVVVNSLSTGEQKRYAVRAYGKDTFRVTPKIGHITAPNGGIVTYPVTIDYFTDINDTVRFDRIKSSIPNLKAGTTTSETTSKADTRTFSFTVPLIYDAGEKPTSPNTVNGTVDFVLNTGKGQRLIPLKLSTEIGTEQYRLTPQKLFVLTSIAVDSIKRKLKLEFFAKEPPKNIVVTSNDDLPLEIQTTQLSDGSYAIDLTISRDRLQDMPLGMNKGELLITPTGRVTHPDITVPVSIFLRQ